MNNARFKNVRFKIAALVGGSVLLTLFIILIILQVVFGRQTEKRARDSVDAYISGSVLNSDHQYEPTMIELSGGFDNLDETLSYYSKQEQRIIKWCKNNDSPEAKRVRLNSRTYYVGSRTFENDAVSSFITSLVGDDVLNFISTEIFPLDELDKGVTVIAYVDVTAELVTIKKMSIFFLIAALIIGMIGSVEGYMIGRRLERSRLAEKQFFENTSHELKTPLTSIRGYAEGIERGVITDYKKTGQVITKETEKMSRLIEEILLSARLDSGAMQLHKETLDLNEFVEECLMPMEGAVISRNLNVNLALSPCKVSADPDRLEQAITNLITNALKYAKSSLFIKLENGQLRMQNDCEYISDNDLSHLFDRFYTGENGNTGIGLALAREIILLHGWKITAGRTSDGIEFVIDIR